MEFNSNDANKQNNHQPPTENECRKNICCRCLQCKHSCSHVNSVPTLSREEMESGKITCRNYECFKNKHVNCRRKLSET